jgi:1-acyl-sn-glycerol-3-phosphate acyltransferase
VTDPAGPATPRRVAEARTSPEALAAARGGVQEGLVWLGREPESRASVLVRLLAVLARLVLFGAFRFKVHATGREHLPAGGGFLLVAAIHRGWMDPFLIMHALPLEPRVWFLGSGPSAFSAKWREWLLHRIGGMLPVWRGGVGVEQHVASAQAVLRNGGVFVLVPEGGVTGPSDAPAAFRVGSALIALRTGALIVPLAMAGSEELYLGRRMATRILPTTSASELLGHTWPASLPEEGSREELDLAHVLTDRLAELFAPVIPELYADTVDPPTRPRRFRGLTWLLLARPKGKRGS